MYFFIPYLVVNLFYTYLYIILLVIFAGFAFEMTKAGTELLHVTSVSVKEMYPKKAEGIRRSG
jgi:hypothetical protein